AAVAPGPAAPESRDRVERGRRDRYDRRHEEAAAARRDRCPGHHRHEEGALGLTFGTALPAPPVPRRGGGEGRRRSHAQRASTPTPTAASSAPPPTAAWRGAGRGTRSRRGTRRVKRRTSQPRRRAVRSSSRSGLTATGCPTASSIGRSVAESL